MSLQIAKTATVFEGLLTRRQRLIDARAEHQDKLNSLQEEMATNTKLMTTGGFDPDTHRDISKIAQELKRVHNTIDKDIDTIFDLTNQASELRTSLSEALKDIPELSIDTLN